MSVYDLSNFENWEVPGQPQAAPAAQPAPAAQSGKKKKDKKRQGHGLIWVMIVLLLVGMAAQPFVMGMLRGEPVSVTGTEINDNGELIVRYCDGSEENLGVVVGKDGVDGMDGKDGVNGTNGTDGTDGSSASGSDVSSAAAIGLRSSVSIYCTFYQTDRRGNVSEYYSAGSGVIYKINKSEGDAFIITNYHVVYDYDSRSANGIAEVIDVYLYGGEIAGSGMTATYVGGSQYYDIAVLRIDDSEVLKNSAAVAVSIADSDQVQAGSSAIAIGNAEGEGISVSSGVISVDSEYITMTASDGYTEVSFRVMRVDTAVNPGNSGGGLFDGRGRLIGIVNAKIMDDEVENIGYALPSTSVIAVADNIIDYCYGTECENVRRSILGVTVVTTGSSAVFDEATGAVSIRETVEIYEVSPDQLGSVFSVGDVLVSVTVGDNYKQITRQHHIIDMLLTARVGDLVVFQVLRNGEAVQLEVTITEACLTDY